MSALFALDVSSSFIEDMGGGSLAAGALVILLIGFSVALILRGFRRPPPRD